MKSLRILLPALGALLFATSPILRAADDRPDGPPPGERRERMAERMAEKLGLSEDQKARMKAIGDQERAEIEALHNDTSLSKDDRRAKGKAIHEKYKAQRDAVLTPEQRAKADKMREHMKERRERREDRREDRAGKDGST